MDQAALEKALMNQALQMVLADHKDPGALLQMANFSLGGSRLGAAA